MKCLNCPSKADPLLEGFCKLCDMLLAGQPPGCVTDNTWMAGVGMGSQFQENPRLGNAYAEKARQEGVSTTGKVYLSGIAAYAGDPQAWVSGRDDIKRIAQERGWTVKGDVNYTPPAPIAAPAPGVDVAPDLIDRGVGEVLQKHPGYVEKPQQLQDLREQVRNRLKPSWAKG